MDKNPTAQGLFEVIALALEKLRLYRLMETDEADNITSLIESKIYWNNQPYQERRETNYNSS